jgi:hypothetical protein
VDQEVGDSNSPGGTSIFNYLARMTFSPTSKR